MGDHLSYDGGLVELTPTVEDVFCFTGCNPYCLIYLSFQTTGKAADNLHSEWLFCSSMDQLAMLPKRAIFFLISKVPLVLQPSWVGIPPSFTLIECWFSSPQAGLTGHSVANRVSLTFFIRSQNLAIWFIKISKMPPLLSNHVKNLKLKLSFFGLLW